MVNRLRLSPLAALGNPRFSGGVHPLALWSFGVLATLVFLMMLIQFFGDRNGGLPAVNLAFDLQGLEVSELVQVAQGSETPPRVLIDGSAVIAAPAESAHEDPLPGEAEAQVVRITDLNADGPNRVYAPAPGDGLRRAPIRAIHADGTHGIVPIIGPAGERASEVYARPFDGPATLPRVALVIGGLGLNTEATRDAIENLPPEVTLSFVPYADNLQRWIDEARAAGHEVVLELPMEPYDYPDNDPGPATLLTSNEWHENESRLEWVMARGTGYIGVMNYQGARLTADAAAFEPVLEDLAAHGLLYLDDGTSQRSLTTRIAPNHDGSWAVANRRIDMRPARTNIDAALLDLEASAMSSGSAIGVGFAYPVTVEQIVGWAETLDAKGLSLAPLSATVNADQS